MRGRKKRPVPWDWPQRLFRFSVAAKEKRAVSTPGPVCEPMTVPMADVRADAVRVEQRGKLAGVFQTVAVADAQPGSGRSSSRSVRFREVGNRFLPAADLAADVEFTRIVNPDDRLDANARQPRPRVLLSRPAAVQVPSR